jgi:hypothetical protein
MFIIETKGGSTLAAAPEKATLQQALSVARAADAGLELDAAFAMLLDWIKAELGAGRLTSSASFAAFMASLQSSRRVSDAVRAALAASGLGQRIVNRLQDLQDEHPFLVTLDGDGNPRLPTLGELEGVAVVDLEFAESKQVATEGATRFKISGAAAARVQLDVLSAHEAFRQHGQPVQGSVLRLRASGALEAGIDVSLAPATFAAGVEASRGIVLLYQFTPDTTSLAALDHLVRDIPAGMQLGDVAAALDLPAQPGFRLLQLERAAGFHFDLSARLGYSQVTLRTVSAAGREQEIKSELAAGAALKVGYRDAGSRQVQVHSDANGDIVLRAESKRAEALSAGLDINAGITITGWSTLARSLMQASLPDAADLLAKLDRWAQPGEWLAARLTQALPKGLEPLIPVLVGASDDAAGALRMAIAELIDSHVNPWTAVLEQRSELLTDALVERIAPRASDAHAASLLRGWLSKQLGGVLGDLRKELLATIADKISDANDAVARQLAQALGDELRAVGRAVRQGASSAADFLQPAIGFLDDYSRLRRKLLDLADRALRFTLEVTLKHELRRTASDTLSFDLRLPREFALAGGPAVEADFRRWLRGAAFVDPMRPFGRPLAEVEGNWKASSARLTESSTSLAIDLGFTGVQAKAMFSSTTQIEVGPGGVLLATTRTESSKASTWGNERVSALGRAMLNAMLSDNPISSFQLDIAFRDAELTEGELRSLIASLRRPAGGILIDDALAATLTAQWQALQHAAGSAPAAVLKLGFALGESGRDALRTLCADSARLRMAIATSMVEVCSGNPARDLGRALATFNYSGDPATLFVQHWEEIRRTLGYGLSRYPTLNGVPISPSSKTTSLSSPWGAANALRRSIRPAHGIYEALSSAAGWPAQQEVVDRALLELRVGR